MKPIKEIPGLWVDGNGKPIPNAEQERARIVELVRDVLDRVTAPTEKLMLDLMANQIEEGKHWAESKTESKPQLPPVAIVYEGETRRRP